MACVAALAAAVPASAAVTIGQLPVTPPAATCTPGADYLQPSVTGGNLYIARQAGTITSWSTSSPSPGARYTFKVFRRTSDPDVFQVIGHAPERIVTAGVSTFPVDVHVDSGDMIGFHESGGSTPCTFPTPGDDVLRSTADLGDGQSAAFTPVTGVRLNLSAVLVPSNGFTITGVTGNRRNGTATLTAELSNPGLATIGGKGLKRSHANTAVATQVTLKIATIGKRQRKLARTGSLKVPVTVTFYPTDGDPSSQIIQVKLRMKREPPLV